MVEKHRWKYYSSARVLQLLSEFSKKIYDNGMIIIVGLGNPGTKFNSTRHNAGFSAVDFFAAKHGFPDFKLSKKYDALVSEKDGILLAKPQTFMNESGKAARKLMANGKGQMENLIVVHDDIDMGLGKIKFAKDSGAGGHKGVDSIIAALGGKDFIRLKIGIATDEAPAGDVVLQKFSPAHQEILDGAIKKSAEALQHFIDSGLEKTMNAFNR